MLLQTTRKRIRNHKTDYKVQVNFQKTERDLFKEEACNRTKVSQARGLKSN